MWYFEKVQYWVHYWLQNLPVQCVLSEYGLVSPFRDNRMFISNILADHKACVYILLFNSGRMAQNHGKQYNANIVWQVFVYIDQPDLW